MSPLIRNGAGLLVVGGSLAGSVDCCCGGCCCDTITLNDLLYGSAEYSWPTLKPSASQEPMFGADTPPPPMPSIYAGWDITGNCAEQAVVMDPQPADATEASTNCFDNNGYGFYPVYDTETSLWMCVERHCLNWSPFRACLRWVCRCVDPEGNVLCYSVHGGPSFSNKNLSLLVTEALGPEPGAGCYVYTIEFFGWRAIDASSIRHWQSGDDMYSVYRTKIVGC